MGGATRRWRSARIRRSRPRQGSTCRSRRSSRSASSRRSETQPETRSRPRSTPSAPGPPSRAQSRTPAMANLPSCTTSPPISLREIGGHLYVSLNAIKTHTRELYRKLGVHSRSEAIARAAALGLLDPGKNHPRDRRQPPPSTIPDPRPTPHGSATASSSPAAGAGRVRDRRTGRELVSRGGHRNRGHRARLRDCHRARAPRGSPPAGCGHGHSDDRPDHFRRHRHRFPADNRSGERDRDRRDPDSHDSHCPTEQKATACTSASPSSRPPVSATSPPQRPSATRSR